MTEPKYPRAEMTSHLLQPAPDLMEIRKALDAATPGPWEVAYLDPLQMAKGYDVDGQHVAYWIAEIYRDEENERRHQDAHLVVNAPTWIAQLLAEVERLQQERDGERNWREDVQAYNLKLAGMIAEEHSVNAALQEAHEREIAVVRAENATQLVTAAEEIRELQEVRETLKEAVTALVENGRIDRAKEEAWKQSVESEARRLSKSNTALLEGMRFYATERNYIFPWGSVVQDAGQRARDLLALYGGKGDTET
ncbi:hypothetical protein BBD42_13035 [Paenibacillus sp. BIHB 4019]|uniref:Uncharacterized protein n=1 Tax=Paenibacillus sp. BIHB 4019 TaxID=1870819 RepID=A0A1B2DHZ4_9BACL|nr:hypothetical protein [Paenibacillus sp. BIHB 4019]ANY67295.1 hypothetical protein BBD42_13035 [Paenibacillus sp. BIHB 4019]